MSVVQERHQAQAEAQTPPSPAGPRRTGVGVGGVGLVSSAHQTWLF